MEALKVNAILRFQEFSSSNSNIKCPFSSNWQAKLPLLFKIAEPSDKEFDTPCPANEYPHLGMSQDPTYHFKCDGLPSDKDDVLNILWLSLSSTKSSAHHPLYCPPEWLMMNDADADSFYMVQ
jgi:hypothetical protein